MYMSAQLYNTYNMGYVARRKLLGFFCTTQLLCVIIVAGMSVTEQVLRAQSHCHWPYPFNNQNGDHSQSFGPSPVHCHVRPPRRHCHFASPSIVSAAVASTGC